jgi:hypothetical protein
LSNGVKVQLGAASAARVWKGRLELERGTGQVTSKTAFQVRASGMAVEGSRYRVAYGADSRLEVFALTGAARVLGARGNLLATVAAGRNMSFALQQAITRNGCLLWKDTGFILQVDDSSEVLQLSGGGLPAQVGNRVQVTGLPTAAQATISPAASVVNVTSLTRTAAGGCLSAAATLTAQTQMPAAPSVTPVKPGAPTPTSPAPTAAKSGGMSTGAKVGIIAAIGGGGAGAALALKGKKESTSP